jgi:hypothetical protein
LAVVRLRNSGLTKRQTPFIAEESQAGDINRGVYLGQEFFLLFQGGNSGAKKSRLMEKRFVLFIIAISNNRTAYK